MTHLAIGANLHDNLPPNSRQSALVQNNTPNSQSMECLPSTPPFQVMSDTGSEPFPPPRDVDYDSDGPFFSTPPTIRVREYPTGTNPNSITIPQALPVQVEEDPFWDDPNPPESTDDPEPESHSDDPFPEESLFDSDKENQCPEEDENDPDQWDENEEWADFGPHWEEDPRRSETRIPQWEQLNPDPIVVSFKTAADYAAYAQERGLVFERGAGTSTTTTPKKRRRSHSGGGDDGQHNEQHDLEEESELETQPSPPKRQDTAREVQGSGSVFERPVELQSLSAFGENHHGQDEHNDDSSYNYDNEYDFQYHQDPLEYVHRLYRKYRPGYAQWFRDRYPQHQHREYTPGEEDVPCLRSLEM